MATREFMVMSNTAQRAMFDALARCCASVGARSGVPGAGPCPNVPGAALTWVRRRATCATCAGRMSRAAPARL